MTDKKKPAKKKPERTGRPINVWLPKPLADALDGYVDSTRPRTTKSGVVEVALEEYLKRQGAWPPPTEDAGPD